MKFLKTEKKLYAKNSYKFRKFLKKLRKPCVMKTKFKYTTLLSRIFQYYFFAYLPVHISTEVIASIFGKIDTATAVQFEQITADLDEATSPIGSDNVDGTLALDVNSTKVFGKRWSNKGSEQENCELHLWTDKCVGTDVSIYSGDLIALSYVN